MVKQASLYTPIDRLELDFQGKSPESLTENANLFLRRNNAVLGTPLDPIGVGWIEGNVSQTNAIKLQDSTLSNVTTLTNLQMAQMLFKFNIVEFLERKYGSRMWEGKTFAEKIAIAKTMITRYVCNCSCYGTHPTGNKATMRVWDPSGAYLGTAPTVVTGTPSTLQISTTLNYLIDAEGYISFLVYGDPANGTLESGIYVDYVYLVLFVTNPYAINKPIETYGLKNKFNINGSGVISNKTSGGLNNPWTYAAPISSRALYEWLNPIEPLTQYTMSWTKVGYAVSIWEVDSMGIVRLDHGWKTANFTFTTRGDTADLVFVVRHNPDAGTVIPSELLDLGLQVEEGGVATTYEPYIPKLKNASLIPNSFEPYIPKLKNASLIPKKNLIDNLKTNVMNLTNVTILQEQEVKVDNPNIPWAGYYKRLDFHLNKDEMVNRTYTCSFDIGELTTNTTTSGKLSVLWKATAASGEVGSGMSITSDRIGQRLTFSFTLPLTLSTLTLAIRQEATNLDGNIHVKNVQIEKSSVATSFEPYGLVNKPSKRLNLFGGVQDYVIAHNSGGTQPTTYAVGTVGTKSFSFPVKANETYRIIKEEASQRFVISTYRQLIVNEPSTEMINATAIGTLPNATIDYTVSVDGFVNVYVSNASETPNLYITKIE